VELWSLGSRLAACLSPYTNSKHATTRATETEPITILRRLTADIRLARIIPCLQRCWLGSPTDAAFANHSSASLKSRPRRTNASLCFRLSHSTARTSRRVCGRAPSRDRYRAQRSVGRTPVSKSSLIRKKIQLSLASGLGTSSAGTSRRTIGRAACCMLPRGRSPSGTSQRRGNRAEDKDKGIGFLYAVVYFEEPLGRERDIFPIYPCVAVALCQCAVQLADKVLVFAGIRNEDVSHSTPRIPVPSLGIPLARADGAVRFAPSVATAGARSPRTCTW